MRLDWKQILPALLAGCLLGFWTGALLPHRRAPRGADRMLDKFSRELRLEAGQRDSLKAVLEGYRPKFDALNEQMLALRRDMNLEISKFLTTEQGKRFQELQARWEARHQRRKGME
jgi:Spy/CpxP family protein refolding chaperone